MKKFEINVTRRYYAEGLYTIEAPDEDAALKLAEDIKYTDARIRWDDPLPNILPE